MQRFGRTTIYVLLGLAGLFIAALIAVNLYVQSSATQQRIQQELSQRLQTQLQIRRISVTPWGGLKLSGITIPQTADAPPGNFLDAKTFRLRIRFPSLFQRRLVIKEVSLLEPHLMWRQNEDGKWRFPNSGAAAEDSNKTELSSANTNDLGTPDHSPVATATVAATPPGIVKSEEKTSFAPEIRRVNLVDGSFQFFDENGKIVARFDGVDFFSTIRKSIALQGNARVARISLRDRFFLADLRSPLRYEATTVDLSDITAHAAGGDVTGSFALQQQAEGSPFTLHVEFKNVIADRVVADAGGPTGVVQGKIDGRLQAAGKTADPDALNGEGEIVLRDGKVQQYSVLAALGQVLQIEELTQLDLQEAHAKFHITPGVVNVDEIVLRSPNIRLSATGTIKFNGKLRLDSRLAINEKVRSRLFRPIAQNFQPTNEADVHAVDFQVSGTVDRPKSNLVDRVVGRDLKDIGSVVDMFLGRDKGDRARKKQKQEEETPAPTSSP